MTAGMAARRRAGGRAGHAGFGLVLRAEWTKFRTVRGWVVGMLVAVLVTVLVGLLASVGRHMCNAPGDGACSGPTVGPGGGWVTDGYYFVRQPLTGDGSITARVTSMTGLITYPPDHPDAIVPGVVPWAKAGVIITPSTSQGSPYAAVMVSGGHGVRMQYNYTQDLAGLPGSVSAASPRWVRLTRSGDTLTGYQSADGTHWAEIGTVTLAGLPVTVQAGLFVASPGYVFVTPGFGGGDAAHLTQATAIFDHVSLQDNAPRGTWAGVRVGGFADGPALGRGGLAESGGRFRVTGTGDLAPTVGSGRSVEQALTGTFAGLIVVIVLGVMFVTAEYRRGLIHATLAASPRRGRVLAAKAIVIGSVSFAVGLAGAAASVPLGAHILQSNGADLYPVSALTELRVITGTGGLFALAGILAVAAGAVARRSTAVVATLIAAIVLPFLLAITNALPFGAMEWLLRLTPAAGFAIQQPIPEYSQVSATDVPTRGYYPLTPWTGFAVLCGYAVIALIVAGVLLRKRDA
jgi:ABC-type transport system involved in multi-copper enzyme maturation permease subunit